MFDSASAIEEMIGLSGIHGDSEQFGTATAPSCQVGIEPSYKRLPRTCDGAKREGWISHLDSRGPTIHPLVAEAAYGVLPAAVWYSEGRPGKAAEVLAKTAFEVSKLVLQNGPPARTRRSGNPRSTRIICSDTPICVVTQNLYLLLFKGIKYLDTTT